MEEQIAAGHQEEKEEPEPEDHVDLLVDDVYCWDSGDRLVIWLQLVTIS